MEMSKNTKKIILDEDEEEEVVVVEQKSLTNTNNHLPLKEEKKPTIIKPQVSNTTVNNAQIGEKLVSNNDSVLKSKSDLLAKIKNQLNSAGKSNLPLKENNSSLLNKKREPKKVIANEEDSESSFTESVTEEEHYENKKTKERPSSVPKRDKKEEVKKKPSTVKTVVKSSAIKKPQAPAIKNKDGLVFEILKRWWYVIDVDWYKLDEDVNVVLKRKGLRQIDLSEWKMQEDVVNGLKKCIELKGFPLVFLDCDEQYHDLRNKQNCPSFNNLIKKVRAITLF